MCPDRPGHVKSQMPRNAGRKKYDFRKRGSIFSGRQNINAVRVWNEFLIYYRPKYRCLASEVKKRFPEPRLFASIENAGISKNRTTNLDRKIIENLKKKSFLICMPVDINY